MQTRRKREWVGAMEQKVKEIAIKEKLSTLTLTPSKERERGSEVEPIFCHAFELNN